ncbi:MAG: hypothetical protein HYZ21_07890 [Chloroflexi bacterium]|nr:hypothetical protein [Chloroflexota bacterium]
MKNLHQRDFLWIVPSALGLGAILASLQAGSWFIGLLGFSSLFLISISLLVISTRWAGSGLDTPLERHSGLPDHQKALAWMVALAFALRFLGGVATYFALPVYGYVDDEDQSAGFVYTDAHRRDAQAWDLAISDRPILDAFNQKFAYDQYGGLLAFSAFIYRYFSPDAHRVLMLVLVSAFMGAFGLPFLWKAVHLQWGGKVALASGWIFALYPESILLGGSAMREPYLMAFSAFALWGFVSWHDTGGRVGGDVFSPPYRDHNLTSILWLAIGIAGMLLVSPSIALVTLVILGGWIYFSSERGRVSWWVIAIAAVVFIVGLFILSSALDRQGNLGGGTPIAVINNFVREALKWNVFKIEEGSGWVQKLFDEMPAWMHMPFVMIYGFLQPVLPAIFIAPTTIVWKVIGILRSLGWYAMFPALILSFVAAAGVGGEKKRAERSRSIFVWLSLVVWGWVLFTALRGGGDQWDNPRYRTILFLWQAILAGNVWVWWRETGNAWFARVIAMEVVFVVIFGQWYANRYLHVGIQMSFAFMVALIIGLWVLIFAFGMWRDRKQRAGHSV